MLILIIKTFLIAQLILLIINSETKNTNASFMKIVSSVANQNSKTSTTKLSSIVSAVKLWCINFARLAGAYIFLSVFMLVSYTNSCFAAQNRQSPLRTFGDYMQIINPLFAAGLASQERGLGHFAIIYSQTFVIMHGTKLIAKSGKWQVSKRPHIENKKDRYEGLPSGHTASAFAAAAYVRTFSDEHKLFSIPLYITATVTGYSRVKAKEHTGLQVVAGAALAEIVTFVNSKLDWSNNYRATNFHFFPKGGAISFEYKF